ncbi:mandelate racemase/muconate lactonizing enzyme family protein [Pengzhenrongella sicca]|uniref:Mandelate racemase/muconate lactonizing enzyme family protein n=1 Tax=Pengzhenrongella sicca TaxID=2819238 RepID=A0A8A4Z903_9MICO|nr:mandelate racemase/muconate lactonizing enzyme family protein [Pengzhenrongella sicca]QTE27901.1 mandelate racemase/muconate lactonizing enzyme family protein [Pengzhenrongella sicca]
MKITGFRLITTYHHWGRPVGDVNGYISEGITEVPLVILETDSGLEGVGLGSHSDIARLFPAIEGQDPRATSSLYDRMLAFVFKSGHGGATFGGIGSLDMALWDLKAKMANEPLWRTLGARDRFVPGYASALEIAVTDDDLAALYSGWVERGFTSAKVKGGRDLDHDLVRLKAVRELFRANTAKPAMMFDANESWNRKQAIRYICALEDQMDLTWVEEPLRRWDAEGLALVSRSVRASIATGENLTGLEQFRPLLDAGAVDIVQTGSVWGITHFLRAATVAHSRDLPISPVGYLTNPVAHAAACVPNHLSTEVQDLSSPFGLTVDQVISDGGIVLGDTPGIGIVIDEPAIGAAQASSGWSTPAGPHVRPDRAGLRLIPEQ